MNQDHTIDPDDLDHHDDQPDGIDDLIDALFAQHLRPPTVEELTGVISTSELLLGACLGFTERQARIIANNRDYLRRLTRAWDVYVPDRINTIAREDSIIGALHRTLLEATGHPLSSSDMAILTAGLDQELEWLLLEQVSVSTGALRAPGSSPDTTSVTGWTCTDRATGTQITLTPKPNGRWAADLETEDVPLTDATLHLHWTNDTITTHQIPHLKAIEEATIFVTPPAADTRPDRASLTTH